MGKGMGSGDWTEAAKQIMANDPPGTEIMISDTINNEHNGHVDGYLATKRDGGLPPKLDKQHGS